MTLQQLYVVLLIGGGVLLASITAARVAYRAGLPSLVFFLAVGVIMGEGGLGLRFDDAQLAQALGTGALALILVEGGLTTPWSGARRLLAPAGVLATAGVGVSVLLTATGAHLLLGMEWRLALLLGAIVSSTDAAAVFAVLRALPLPPKLSGLLEAESGFNDAPTIILVLAFSSTATGLPGPGHVFAELLYQLVVGAALALVIGWLGVVALRRIALPATGLYPLATVGFGVVAFAGAGAVGASGIIAAYLAGVVLGNARLPHRGASRSFAEGVGWLAQIGLFVMLGLLVSPARLPEAAVAALVVGLVLLLVARPVSVLACLIPFRVPWREQAFLSWAGLRGAVPIVLATFPIVAGVEGAWELLHIVFVLVMVFTLVQGPSLPTAARLLHLISPGQARELQVEAAPLDVLGADLLTLTVPPGSRLHGVEIAELRLPAAASITLIIRAGAAMVPAPDTRLAERDEVLIVATEAARDAAERRLRAVGRRGRLAYWLGEYGDRDGEPT
ncbi:potassium/proton antiporter [Actinomadura sp. WMMB 499]|uniref:potassium/proton antiporter n=1 Tax=Actinomadura sp. WMMB 499 TaxID=1219491 RepID=UPI001245A311|nr:potassium/proton antiporter [Actinomadura sp. WMMB 499]QFG26183.1 potassium/proton antiporter [Actinomadura sp. WMMB 499]